MCGVEVLACLACGVAGGAAAKKKGRHLFGRKKQPDSPKLPYKQHAEWGLEEQEQWTRQEPASLAHHQAASQWTSLGQKERVSAVQSSAQQDWYGAALQQSAQLDEIAKQEESEQADSLPSVKDRPQKHLRRRSAAGQAAAQDGNWFNIALQKSSQLDQLGPKVQADCTVKGRSQQDFL
ncbi:hypothetical protein ABBQ32_013029 [Trebouxia sp. C0010 RCD-2024]